MDSLLKIAVVILAGIAGFALVAILKPFGDSFDYNTATLEQKQSFLERKAKNFTRGFNLTSVGASEISDTYADAEFDLVSISVKLTEIRAHQIPHSEVEKARKILMRSACRLSERKLLEETPFNMRVRFFGMGGSPVLTANINGETCTPYYS